VNEPSLESVIPAASREAISDELKKSFESQLKLPKGMNRHLVARAIDRVLLGGQDIDEVQREMGLVYSEVGYVVRVVFEYRAWEEANKAR
jgi:hypothetical protein